MEWMTVKEAGALWGISPRRATILCAEGKVNGAQRLGNIWVIPKGTDKPLDGRTKNAKESQSILRQ
jgi:hypothetical protein